MQKFFKISLCPPRTRAKNNKKILESSKRAQRIRRVETKWIEQSDTRIQYLPIEKRKRNPETVQKYNRPWMQRLVRNLKIIDIMKFKTKWKCGMEITTLQIMWII